MKKPIENINRKSADAHGVPYESIPTILKDQNYFAVRIDVPFVREIGPGMSLSGKTIELGEGHFTNMYDIRVAPECTARAEVRSQGHPLLMKRYFAKDQKTIAGINGAFLYLADDIEGIGKQGPKDPNLNWCMRGETLVGLPASDRPAVFIKDGKVCGKEIVARGKIKIGESEIEWTGGADVMHAPKQEWERVYKPQTPTLFNSACCRIAYEDPLDKKSLRCLDMETYYTPKHPDVAAITVSLTDSGKHQITSITQGGGAGLFDGHFILQVPTKMAEAYSVGQTVTPLELDGMSLQGITSALTVGPAVHHFLTEKDHPVNHDASLGTLPPFGEGLRYARSAIYEDVEGGIHLTIFDGAPRSDFFKGVSPKEVAERIPQSSTKWAFFLDGGQSVRLAVKDASGQIHSMGNKQYVRLTEPAERALLSGSLPPDTSFLWSSEGRPVPSGIFFSREE